MEAISASVDGLEDMGVKFIGAISGGIVKVSKGVGNTTSTLISSASKGVAAILSKLGGIPTLVVFGIEVLIVTYLVMERWQGNPPPLPPRQIKKNLA